MCKSTSSGHGDDQIKRDGSSIPEPKGRAEYHIDKIKTQTDELLKSLQAPVPSPHADATDAEKQATENERLEQRRVRARQITRYQRGSLAYIGAVLKGLAGSADPSVVDQIWSRIGEKWCEGRFSKFNPKYDGATREGLWRDFYKGILAKETRWFIQSLNVQRWERLGSGYDAEDQLERTASAAFNQSEADGIKADALEAVRDKNKTYYEILRFLDDEHVAGRPKPSAEQIGAHLHEVFGESNEKFQSDQAARIRWSKKRAIALLALEIVKHAELKTPGREPLAVMQTLSEFGLLIYCFRSLEELYPEIQGEPMFEKLRHSLRPRNKKKHSSTEIPTGHDQNDKLPILNEG